jgi:peptide/nickel transport system permease protein
LSAAVAGASGVAVGGVAGYAGGAIDTLLMRGTDAMLAVPRLPLLMIATSVLQPSVPLLVLLIGLAGWMETARVVRAEFATLRGRGFVENARAAGAGHARIIGAHLLPNAAHVVIVSLTLAVARGIQLESALSFFGVGVQPPRASWGKHALPGAGDARHRAVAGVRAGVVHPDDNAVGEYRGRIG